MKRLLKFFRGRLARWTDRLIPFDFKLQHIAGRKLGFVDYISRNLKTEAKPLFKYVVEFVVAQIDAFL